MFAKVLGAMFGAKATVVSGAILVAGALVSASAPSIEAAPQRDEPRLPELEQVLVALPSMAPSPAPESPVSPVATTAPSVAAIAVACTVDATTRGASLETIRSAFASSHSSLGRIAVDRTRPKAAETLQRATTMLASVDRTAEELVSSSATCAADVRDVTDRAVHAMGMIVELARTATAPTPTPQPTKKPEPTKKKR